MGLSILCYVFSLSSRGPHLRLSRRRIADLASSFTPRTFSSLSHISIDLPMCEKETKHIGRALGLSGD